MPPPTVFIPVPTFINFQPWEQSWRSIFFFKSKQKEKKYPKKINICVCAYAWLKARIITPSSLFFFSGPFSGYLPLPTIIPSPSYIRLLNSAAPYYYSTPYFYSSPYSNVRERLMWAIKF